MPKMLACGPSLLTPHSGRLWQQVLESRPGLGQALRNGGAGVSRGESLVGASWVPRWKSVRARPWAGEHPPLSPLPMGLPRRPAPLPARPLPPHLINLQAARPSRTPSGDSQIKPNTGEGKEARSPVPRRLLKPWALTWLGLAAGVLGVGLTEGSLCPSQSRGTFPVPPPS